MKKIKIVMIADALMAGFTFAKGKKYTVDYQTYQCIKQSCEIREAGKKEKKPFPELKHILVVVSHGLGNIINKTPMLKKIKELWPDIKIDLLMRKQYVNILKDWDIIDNCIAHEPEANKFALSSIKYDLIINSLPTAININVLDLKGDVISGESQWFQVMHEVEANIKILETYLDDILDVPTPYIPMKKVSGYETGKYIGICAGWDGKEYWSIKNWGYKRYAELIVQLLKRHYTYKIIVFGIGKDKKVLDSFMKGMTIKASYLVNAVDKYTVNETAYLISKCDFLVCNDTGLGHVASAVGTKTYSIFAGSSVVKNHPYLKSNIISKGLDCQPCQFTNRWPLCKDAKCMNISPEQVFDIIIKNEKKIKKSKLGIVIATYNRLELLENLFISLYRCINFKDIAIALVDDGTDDNRLDKILDIWIKLFKKSDVDLKIVTHKYNYGKKKFSKTIKDGVDALSESEYILFMPDDIIVNPYLFDVIKCSYKYFKGKMQCISYMADTRAIPVRGFKSLYTPIKEHDKYFDRVEWADGFLTLYKNDTLKKLKFHNNATGEGSGFWTKINEQLKSKGIIQLRYKESLCLHICSDTSKMNPEEREVKPIQTIECNLLSKPKILSKEKN